MFELLRAFHFVFQRRPDLSLVLCGTGPEAAELRALAVELDIASNVVFPGWVDGAQKAALFTEASVLCCLRMPKAPMSILEAMVAEVPVVATAVGGIPDMLDHGTCGLLVPRGCRPADRCTDTSAGVARGTAWRIARCSEGS